MKNADCTSIASAYVSTKISLSFGMMTSFRLVMPPNTKNSANTKTRRSGASTPATAEVVELDDEVLRRGERVARQNRRRKATFAEGPVRGDSSPSSHARRPPGRRETAPTERTGRANVPRLDR